MKYVAIAALLLCGLTTACSVSHTTVERPVPASTAAVVVPAGPPPPTTVYVPD